VRCHQGLLRVEPATGGIEPITDRVDGVRMRFCNNAEIAADGTVWFTDSSTLFGIDGWKDDLVQHTRTGRLLRLGEDGEVEVVLEGLAFANGVALGRRRVLRRRGRDRRADGRTTVAQRAKGRPSRLPGQRPAGLP
jgi:sugar lactone lactonase YvrE